MRSSAREWGKGLFASALCLSLLAPAVMADGGSATGLTIPPVPEGEKLVYSVTYADREEKSFAIDGELSGMEQFSYTTDYYEADGKKFLKTTEVEKIRGGKHNETETHFELGSYMKMVRYTERVYSYTGKEIRRQSADYDDPVFDFPGPTILTHCITYWLRGIDFQPGKSAEFYLMLLGDASPPWRMHARVFPETEEVTVPAGTFTCYKVQIDPDYKHFLGEWAWASIIIKPLVPDFFIWYSVDDPHPMVKFEGALGIKGITSVETHELVSKENAGT